MSQQIGRNFKSSIFGIVMLGSIFYSASILADETKVNGDLRDECTQSINHLEELYYAYENFPENVVPDPERIEKMKMLIAMVDLCYRTILMPRLGS